MEKDFYTPLELATRIDIKESTVRAWAREGQIKAVRFGKAWRIPRIEYERIIREGVRTEETDEEMITLAMALA
jgi:excisionase family DNA binding protein